MSVEKLFEKLFSKTFFSSYICLALSVMGKKVPHNSIKILVNKKVDKKDYQNRDFENLCFHLAKITDEKLTYEQWSQKQLQNIEKNVDLKTKSLLIED